MSDMTDSTVAVAKHLELTLRQDMATGPGAAIHSVYYGDQTKIPFVPTACIETGEKRRALNGAPRRTDVTMTIYILVYLYEVKSTRIVREEADQLAEDIETWVHQDVKLDGLVYDSLVTGVEYGYAQRGESLFRSARLTIEGRSQVQLPSNI